MANPWFRMYSEFAIDPKVQMMSEADQRRFIMLLCLRCSNDDVTLQDDEIAFQLRISADEWAQSKALFLSKGLINDDNTPVNWDKRQFVSDSSAERVRRHREKKKQAAKRPCNVTATPPDTDTETETDIGSKAAASTPPPEAPEDKPPAALADPVDVRVLEIVQLLRQRGAAVQTGNPQIRRWAEQGVTDAQLLTAYETAEERRAAARSSAPINAGFLDSILSDIRAGPAARAPRRPASRAQRVSDWMHEAAESVRQTERPREIDMGVIDASDC